jgi:TonB-dependent starch-binding outer membrane protein SusC
MKKYLSYYGLFKPDSNWHKLFLTMKITIFLLSCCLVNIIAAPTYSQATKVSLNLKNASIEEVLNKIEDISEFYFLYNNKLIDVTRKVNIEADNESIKDILNEILNEDTKVIIYDRQIILTPGDVMSLSEAIQQLKLTGTVTDDKGNPLPGVSVIVKGTTIGTLTDAAGKYTLNDIPQNATLIFSFVGMIAQEIPVDGRKLIDVVLNEGAIGLEEVVVIGYGTVKKSDLTGSVSQISNEQLRSTPVYDFTEAMKARASGVQVSKNSGKPGGNVEVRIRGGNSMVGSNSPLFVVDGFPIVGTLNYLNPADIKSIDILKDASATAIYGSRGANGVVIITTKRGQLGQKGTIDFSSSYGVQKAAKLYELLDAKQYATVANEWLKNEGFAPYFDLDNVENPGTNWQDEIFRTAPEQNHTLTFSGGSENTNYSLSANYYAQEGIVINSGVKRGSLRLNLDHKINKIITLGLNSSISRREVDQVPVDNGSYGCSMFDGALAAPPTLPVYDDNGVPTRIESIYSFGNLDMRNPLIYKEPYKDRFFVNGVLINTFLDFNILEGLTFKTQFGLQYQNAISERFTPLIFTADVGYASNGYSYYNSFLNENTINYLKTFNNTHTLNIVAGLTSQTYLERSESASVSKLANNIVENFDLASAEIVNAPSDAISDWHLLSYLGRVNYSFKNKYLFTSSIRMDGSSRFGVSNKWGIFPSAAIAWKISEEPFLKNISFISDAKLRASYGVTGNTALSPYQSLDRLNSVRMVEGGNSESIGYIPSAVGNSELKWEKTGQLDIGFDLGIFEGRIEMTFDYYNKVTSDLLATIPLPPSVGFSSSLKNSGKIQNRGIEFSCDANIIDKSFKWDIMGQISANRSKVLELEGNSDIFGPSDGHPFNATLSIARVGEPLGVFYGRIEDGLDDQGFIKYKDLDENGVINALDRTIIGNPYPKFIFGLSNDFSYRNFDLSIFLEGVYGNDIFWETAGIQLDSFHRGNNQMVDLIGNYWTPENPDPNAKYPKPSSKTVADVSDRYVEDGSYLRVQTLKLAYNIPISGLAWCKRAQIYLSGTNLFTFTNYPGLDPDVNTHGNDFLLNGIDKSAYPVAKILSAGLNVSF